MESNLTHLHFTSSTETLIKNVTENFFKGYSE